LSKQVLKAGSIVIDNQCLGLLDVSVIDAPTKLDVSSTANPNAVAIGRENWAFSAVAMKNNSQMVKPTQGTGGQTAGETIVITFGGECWFGSGVITSVELSGRLDDKVIYNIQGEFIPNTYHIAANLNMTLQGGGASGIPDDWVLFKGGSGDAQFDYNNKDGRSWFLNNLTVYIDQYHLNVTIESGETYGHCIVYASDNLSSIVTGYQEGGGSSLGITPADTGGAVTIWTHTTYSGAANDDLFRLISSVGGGGAYLKLFSVNFGKILKSLT
jgi:hypothetical protein